MNLPSTLIAQLPSSCSSNPKPPSALLAFLTSAWGNGLWLLSLRSQCGRSPFLPPKHGENLPLLMHLLACLWRLGTRSSFLLPSNRLMVSLLINQELIGEQDLNISTHTHTHTRVTIKEKEAMNLRDCMGQCMVDIKWRKGKEEVV